MSVKQYTRRQARRHSERQERGASLLRQGLRVLLALALTALVSWGAYTLARPSTFPVRHVQLSGELGRIDTLQLRERILPHVMHGLLRVDVNGLRESVESLPWVRNAGVRRVWPDVVEVQIQEQKPLAQWGEAALVNEEGSLFTPPEPEWPAGLPVFEGPENTSQTMALRYRELHEVLTPLGLRVTVLSMNQRRALTMDLENGIRLLLGRSDQQPRLERLVRAYAQVIEGRVARVRQVDLRYTNGFTVIWKEQGPQA